MILETASVELVEEKNIYKKIEWAGRICYKSLDKVSEKSYKDFIRKKIIRSGHYSVLEHADITIQTNASKEIENVVPQYLKTHFYFSGERVYANVRAWRELLEDYYNLAPMIKEFPIFFGDIEVISKKDNGVSFEVLDNSFSSARDFLYGKRETFLITTTRDISHQIVRHRLLSISQESQRYCNYSKDKHGYSIRFIKPNFVQNKKDYELWTEGRIIDEAEYFHSLKEVKPEEARNCLPNCVATDLVLTANLWEWRHIFNLRCAKDAQPEIRNLMIKAKNQLLQKYKHTTMENLFID